MRIDFTKVANPDTSTPAGRMMTVAGMAQSMITGRALPRDLGTFQDNNMGPHPPMVPYYLDQPNSRTGMPEPRQFQYPVGFNLPTGPRALEPVSFATLRSFAKNCDIIRNAIEVQKKEIARAEFDISLRQGAASDGSKGYKKDRINEIRRWFDKPDPIEGYMFDEWIMAAIEEQLTIDALSILPRRKVSGELVALTLIDGATIKPLLATNGGRPQPPNPAYQQFLWGVPRNEFVMAQDFAYEEGASADLNTNQLIYRPFNRRVHTPWGFPPVEWSMLNAVTYMRRMLWWQGYFNESNMPAGFLEGADGWSPDELQRYENAFNAMVAGDPSWQWKIKIIPHGHNFQPVKQPNFDTTFDQFIIKMMLMPFGVHPQELGINEQGSSMGGRGQAEANQEASERRGIEPWMRRFTNIFNWVIQSPIGFDEPDIEFRFRELELEDAATQATVDEKYINMGVRTRRNVAENRGWEIPDDEEMADILTITTPQGVIPLNQFKGGLPTTVPYDQPATNKIPQTTTTGQPASGPAGNGAVPARPAPVRPAVAKLAEIKAFKSFAQRPYIRDFAFKHVEGPWATLLNDGLRDGGDLDEIVTAYKEAIDV